MTTRPDDYMMRAANALPHSDPDPVEATVESIMADRKVGRKYAYAILRQMQQERYAGAPVPNNQRERVLSILYRSDGEIRTSNELMESLQQEGYAIDGHDATKVLWSLQKTNHVRFREHQNPKYLYGIALTAQGKADAKKIVTRKPEVEEIHATIEPVVEKEPEVEVGIVQAVGGPYSEDAILVPVPDEPEPPLAFYPWPNGMGDAFRLVRDRAIKAQKLNAAAKLLEEAGEDDMVLALMGKTDFTPLEQEVIEILKLYGEID